MNRVEHVDLTNCDREPIHQLGSIQPIGFLITMTADWLIVRVSANTASFIGLGPEALLGRPLSDIFTIKAVHDLRNRTTLLRGPDAVERIYDAELIAGASRFDVALHNAKGSIVLEAEPVTSDHGDAAGTVRSMIARLDQSADLATFLREGVRQVRALVNYDRVMAYQFASDGSGQVVAEVCKPGIGRFLGLRYPASDIPVQARELYKRNLLRVIADVDAQSVEIVPRLDQDGKPLDLSLSTLRSVSPIHIEYLKNMGVAASMSISIIVEGRLWGLFACHNYSAHRPSFESRATAELFAQMFSMRLESRERQDKMEYERRARDISDQLLGAIASDDTLLKDPDWIADMLTRAIPADGVGVWIAGSYSFSGVTPPTADFRRIVRALNATAAGKIYATDSIGALIPDAQAFASDAAGLLAIPISRSPRDYVVLFRSELVRSVRWAGDPHKPVDYGPNGPRLTPRASFAEWTELVRGRSQPFTEAELRVAETLRATLIEVVLRLADEASAERQQATARQELLIAELNHRVRNILGLIRGLIRQSNPGSEEIAKFVKIVDGRVHALARAHNQITDDHWGPAPLNALIDAEAAVYTEDRERLIVDGTPVLLNPQAYSTMALVIHELVTNSAKYGALSAAGGTVNIQWRRVERDDLEISWHEKGGPKVSAPSRKGFGSTIIDRSVPYDLGGAASVAYKETGVEAWFRIPRRHVAEAQAFATERKFKRPAVGHPQPMPAQMLGGHTVLLVEDSLIIALDVEDILTKLGAEHVLTAATADGALDMIGEFPPSVAMLDINLGQQTSFVVADMLDDSRVPFFFATGYGEQADLPDRHRGRPVVQKPYTVENVVRAMSDILMMTGESPH